MFIRRIFMCRYQDYAIRSGIAVSPPIIGRPANFSRLTVVHWPPTIAPNLLL
jgi:hypothetical protein